MHVSKLLIGSFLLALGVPGCSDDTNPGPSPTPDSGNPPADTGTPGETGGGDAQDAGDTIPPGDMRPCGASTIAVGDTSAKLTHMGVEYSYLVHVPPTYDGSKRTPLVINWHGALSSGVQQQFYTQTDPVADAEGFIVVYPSSPNQVWAAGTCCPVRDAGPSDHDDIGFARALVAQISSVACVDAKKVYSMGMSNGGFMSHRLACEAADMFAAVVSVAGKMGVSPCTPSRPVPVLQIHGTADTTIPYENDRFSPEGVDVPGMMAAWATRDGCTKGPDTTFQMGNSTCQAWSQCSAGSEVKLCTQTGDEHCWPGATFCLGALPYSMDISATKESWKFLRRFALP